jgi:hypothetical protein
MARFDKRELVYELEGFDGVGDIFYLVALIDVNDCGFEVAKLFVIVKNAIADDNDLIANCSFAGSRTVQANNARAGRTLDKISLEALAVIDVNDRNLLIGQEIGRSHKLGIERKRALVIEICLRDSRPVDLGFE